MKILTNKTDFPKDQLMEFLNALKKEDRFFLRTHHEIMRSEILIYEDRLDHIVGIAGIHFLAPTALALFKVPLAYMAVLPEFQRQGIGAGLYAARYEMAQGKYHYLFHTISKDNHRMLRLIRKFNARYLGETVNRYYFLTPFTHLGLRISYFMKIALKLVFPLRSFA